MSITEAEDRNRAELTPDQPCAVCGAEHDEESGTAVGRIDEDSDLPMAIPNPMEVEGNPFDLSFCNDCIETHLNEIQQSVKILKPSEAQVAAYMLLGLPLQETVDMVNARKDGEPLQKGTVRDYRTRARRSVREAMEMGLGGSPILKQTKKN